MANNNIVAVLGVGAVAALGFYFFRKKKGTTGGESEAPELSGAAYDRPSSIRIRGIDRGYGATAVAYNEDGSVKNISDGSLQYRYGDRVSFTEPIFFGAQSYRATRCVPVRALPFSDQGVEKYLWGDSRYYQPDNPGDVAWATRNFQTGQGWQTNGRALIAKSWSCNLSRTQGTNNARCLTQRNRENTFDLGRQAGGLGFLPFLAEYTQRFLDLEGDAVPFIGYGNVSTGSQTGGRTYRELNHRATKQGRGFLDQTGAVWIAGSDSLNFRYISDENRNIVYHYCMKGAGGTMTALNTLTHQTVPKSRLRPRWMDLTHNETMYFVRTNAENFAKIDPWSIPGSPWQVMDRMERAQFEVQGRRYDIDYRGVRGGNPVLRLVAREAPSSSNATAANIPYVSWASEGLRSGYAWPTPNYGLIDPWRNVNADRPNAMPYDFAMPIWMHVWKDMHFTDDLRFVGDVQRASFDIQIGRLAESEGLI